MGEYEPMDSLVRWDLDQTMIAKDGSEQIPVVFAGTILVSTCHSVSTSLYAGQHLKQWTKLNYAYSLAGVTSARGAAAQQHSSTQHRTAATGY